MSVSLSCSPGGVRESGRNSWWSVSKFTTVRMQMEFPADYTEVKQAGADKERKTSPVPHHTNLQPNGANTLTK